MKSMGSMPHDAVFKAFLSSTETARDFIELHLPVEFRSICDLRTLKLESGSFIEENLRASYCDVLYSLKTTAGDSYIHVLIEHQSTLDKHMAFRMLRYSIAAMQRHLDAGHHKLPLVIPILFYTGSRSPYPWVLNWLNEFDDPELAKGVYTRDFPLVDITVIPDDEIMEHRSMAALTLLQKHIYQRDLLSLVDKLSAILLAGRLTGHQLVALINYLVQTGETADAKAFLYQLARRVPQHGEELMTIAQQLEQIGIDKGIREGLQLGKIEGKREIALKLLQSGMSLNKVKEITGLSDMDLEQINR